VADDSQNAGGHTNADPACADTACAYSERRAFGCLAQSGATRMREEAKSAKATLRGMEDKIFRLGASIWLASEPFDSGLRTAEWPVGDFEEGALC
jgi:hypothetical protein